MEELSIEEKAKAYDEALERARIWKDKSGMPADKQGILDDIFPELAGSEDEQIRKELTKHLKEGVEGYMPAGDSSDYRRWLAWLEKQGERKSQRMISAEAKEAMYDKPAWSEEDRTMAFTLMRDIDQMSYISEEGKNERIGWLNSLDEKFALRKSSWSKEDDVRLQACIDTLQAESLMGKVDTVMTKWLKSLKQRIGGKL